MFGDLDVLHSAQCIVGHRGIVGPLGDVWRSRDCG